MLEMDHSVDVVEKPEVLLGASAQPQHRRLPDLDDFDPEVALRPILYRRQSWKRILQGQSQTGPVAQRQSNGTGRLPKGSGNPRLLLVEWDHGNLEPLDLVARPFQWHAVLDHLAKGFRQIDR